MHSNYIYIVNWTAEWAPGVGTAPGDTLRGRDRRRGEAPPRTIKKLSPPVSFVCILYYIGP